MNDSLSLLNAPSQKKILIIITVMCVAILEVLDSTIINVALPHMMPALSANRDEITWVLTSYIVASAIMIPLTGFLSRLLGERRLLLINTSGFMLSSLLCGTATSLSAMVALRCLQGAFGAALIPLSQSILKQSFPIEKQGKAMAIWGMGVLVAPVLGPTLGGIITEHASWRWVFYINLPVCATALILALINIPKTQGSKTSIDVIGIVLLFLGIGSLQLFLDQGNMKDWFSSHAIILLLITCIVCLTLLVIWSINTWLRPPQIKPALRLRLFANRNFRYATLCLAIFCGTQFSLLTLEPIMLQRLFGYTPLISGLALMPMGLFSTISVGITSILINRTKIKYILLTGSTFSIIGSHYLSTLTLNSSLANFITANAIMGFGMGFFMVPLSVYALANLPEDQITDGAGLYSYGRMLGTSIGISLMNTIVSRESQINTSSIGIHISQFSTNLKFWLAKSHMLLNDPHTQATLQNTVLQQANFRAYIDTFYLSSFCFAIMIPLMLMMRHVQLKRH